MSSLKYIEKDKQHFLFFLEASSKLEAENESRLHVPQLLNSAVNDYVSWQWSVSIFERNGQWFAQADKEGSSSYSFSF